MNYQNFRILKSYKMLKFGFLTRSTVRMNKYSVKLIIKKIRLLIVEISVIFQSGLHCNYLKRGSFQNFTAL